MSLIPVIKAEFSALSLQSSVPRDPSVSQETIIIINVENSWSALKLWCLCNVNVFTVTFEQFNESGLDKNFLSLRKNHRLLTPHFWSSANNFNKEIISQIKMFYLTSFVRSFIRINI